MDRLKSVARILEAMQDMGNIGRMNFTYVCPSETYKTLLMGPTCSHAAHDGKGNLLGCVSCSELKRSWNP